MLDSLYPFTEYLNQSIIEHVMLDHYPELVNSTIYYPYGGVAKDAQPGGFGGARGARGNANGHWESGRGESLSLVSLLPGAV